MIGNRLDMYLCLAMFATCLDQGDGRWRAKDKEKIIKDIVSLRNIADEIEYEIEDFYDELDNIAETINEEQQLPTLRPSFVTFISRSSKQHIDQAPQSDNEVTDKLSNKRNETFAISALKNNFKRNESMETKKIEQNIESWPDFNDLLLSFGKKYDWKNDRWIKVRQKVNSDSGQTMNTKSFKEKHNFSYRIVKLKRSKSRRNVVIAVKAVR